MIQLNPKIILDGSKLCKTLLLSDCPRLTDIGLKELASKEEVVGLNMRRANVEAIAKVFFQANILPLPGGCLIFQLIEGNPGVPSQLSSWKEKDIAQ